MLLKNPPFAFQRFQKQLLIFGLTLFALTLSLIFPCVHFSQQAFVTTPLLREKVEVFEVFHGSHPVAFWENHLKAVAEEIRLVAIQSHPTKKGSHLLLTIGKQKEMQEVLPNERFYLHYQKAGLAIADHDTPLWIEIQVNEGVPQIAIHLWHPMEGEAQEIGVTIQTNLEPLEGNRSDFIQQIDPLPEGAWLALKESHWLGKDLFFRHYGGDYYQSLAQKLRLLIGGDLCYVAPGDFLAWEGTRWVPAPTPTLDNTTPVARITPHMELEVWGSRGYFHEQFPPLEWNPKGVASKMEEVCVGLRRRSASSVSCRIGNKHFILKEGDWLFHNDREWQLLQAKEDIAKVLNFDKQGELFIFDRLDKMHLLGKVFSADRAAMEEVRIPLAQKTVVHPKKPESIKEYPYNDDFIERDEDYPPPVNGKKHHESVPSY